MDVRNGVLVASIELVIGSDDGVAVVLGSKLDALEQPAANNKSNSKNNRIMRF